MAPGIVYYYYFSSDDMDDIRSFKDGLKRTYGLDSKEEAHSSPRIIRGFKLLASVQGDEVSLNTLIWRNITLIEVMISKPPEKWRETIAGHNKVEEEMDASLMALLGKGMVFIAPPGEELTTDGIEPHYPITEMIKVDLIPGTLHLLKPWDKEQNTYGFTPGEDYHEFLLGDLPFINGLVHKIERESEMYLARMGYMKDKRSECDDKVGKILGRTMIADLEERQVTLEKELTELSNMYSGLAMDTSSAKRAVNTVKDDVNLLEARIEDLLAEGGHNSLARELERYWRTVSHLEDEEGLFTLALDKVKEALDVVRTRVELMSSREQLNLQRERYNLQAAAGILEVIIVLYYSMVIWKTLADEDIFHHIPYYYKLLLTASFAFLVFLFTHYTAHAMAKEKKFNKGMGLSLLAGLIVMAIVYLITFSPYHV